ncbi:MAG: hypothetical protein COY69_02095, partial [Candidatus Magasanikbacteria bacterium CG_4_10_14_0_8_um_filter_32_14]
DGKDFTGRNIGFCLPAGETVTSISFGGRTKFSNIGEFIKFIYQYAFIIGSVIAVMVIIVAGVMYIFSGGNSDTVGQAKKKIYGAITGLVLMALSFTILKTINPYLVELRLPSIWAINTSGIAPVNCESLDQGPKKVTMIALAKNQSATTPPTDLASAKFFIPDSTTAENTPICGNDYYVDKTNGQTCGGTSCPQPNTVCYQGINDKNNSCKKGKIGGRIYGSGLTEQQAGDANFIVKAGVGLFTNFWAWIWIRDIELRVICNESDSIDDTDIEDSETKNKVDENKKIQEYSLSYTEQDVDKMIGECDEGKFVGFVIAVDLNLPNEPVANEQHLLGLDKNDQIVDLYTLPSSGGSWYETYLEQLVKTANLNTIKQYLIPKEKILKGFPLNIDVSNINNIELIKVLSNDKATQLLNNTYGKLWGIN